MADQKLSPFLVNISQHGESRRTAMFGKLLRPVREFLASEEFHVKSSSVWHARLYLYWLKTGGQNREGYQENWCHYWRVVLLYALRRWLFTEEILWDGIKRGKLLIWFLIGFWGALIFFEDFWSRVVMAVSYVLLMAAIYGFPPFLDRFVRRRSVRSLWVWSFFLAAMVGYIWAVVLWPLSAVIIPGAFVGVFVAMKVVAGLKEWWPRRHRRRINRQAPAQEPAERRVNAFLQNIVGTTQFVGQFFVARKRRICPYVAFDFDLEQFIKKQQPTAVGVA